LVDSNQLHSSTAVKPHNNNMSDPTRARQTHALHTLLGSLVTLLGQLATKPPACNQMHHVCRWHHNDTSHTSGCIQAYAAAGTHSSWGPSHCMIYVSINNWTHRISDYLPGWHLAGAAITDSGCVLPPPHPHPPRTSLVFNTSRLSLGIASRFAPISRGAFTNAHNAKCDRC
jgi:hypothetical protein